MNRKLIVTLIVAVLCGSAYGQAIKFRLGANGGMFQKETGPEEVLHPVVIANTDPNSTDFTSNFESGFEAELMYPLSQHFESGLEFEYSNYSGYNNKPPFFNYYFAQENPTQSATNLPLVYESSVMSFLVNFRYLVFPNKAINPFVKAIGGLSFVGTELNYEDRNYGIEQGVDYLYAIGTANSEKGREAALYYGGGAGVMVSLTDKFSLYIDATAAIINSDKVDGIPNYDYDEVEAIVNPVGNKAFISQISLGLVFSPAGSDAFMKGKGGVKRTGRTSEYFPFYRQK